MMRTSLQLKMKSICKSLNKLKISKRISSASQTILVTMISTKTMVSENVPFVVKFGKKLLDAAGQLHVVHGLIITKNPNHGQVD